MIDHRHLDGLPRGAAAIPRLPVVVSVAANVWLWRRRASPSAGTGDPTSGRSWLGDYALWTFVACFVANGLSPSVVTWWHNLIALHAAVLPLVLGADARLATSWAPWTRIF